MLPKMIDIPFRCAVKDRDFFCRFRINQFLPSKYFFERLVEPPVSGEPAAETNAITVATSALPLDGVRCPYCSAKVFVRCGSCHRLLCQGRVTGNFFFCSDSCGGSGPIAYAHIMATGHQALLDTPRARLTYFQAEPQIGRLPQATPTLRLPGPQAFLPTRKR